MLSEMHNITLKLICLSLYEQLLILSQIQIAIWSWLQLLFLILKAM